ncbi:hypothetical protein KC318_g5937 [Hortaea werneckii]|nr:hypothetical protein KC318_g5937 [Hortaea werneckii]
MAATAAATATQVDTTTIPSQDLNGPVTNDLPTITARYEAERAKRLRDQGAKQYIDPSQSAKFRKYLEDPWIQAGTPIHRPVPHNGHCKIAIIGAGFGGILFAVKLIQQGYRANDLLLIDPAGGFGGMWYWNRYPGLMCDVESYIYMPLLEEMGYMPRQKYASGEELREYIERVAGKYGLGERAMFQSSAQSARWEEEKQAWRLAITEKPKGGTSSQIEVDCDFVLLASGLLNNVKLPQGIETFEGHMFHTARWDYDYTGGSQEHPEMTRLADKRVAILGTGATAIQAVPQLAKFAKELYVFQRTPSMVDERGQRETDPKLWKEKIASKKGWQRERNENFCAFVSNQEPKPAEDLVNDGWTNCPSFSALVGGPQEVTMENVSQHVSELHAMDVLRTDRVRRRAEAIVEDPVTAKNLMAWYPSWCKRPCSHDDYLPSFNRPNVHLIDTDGQGISGITSHGLIAANGEETVVDAIIIATGFVSPQLGTAAGKAGMSVQGRNGQCLESLNDTGDLTTLHGIASHGFPNLFWPGPLQGGATANQSFVLDMMSAHIVYVMASARARVEGEGGGRRPVIEPEVEAQEQWAMMIMSKAASFAAIRGCTPGYLNLEGENDKIAAMPPEAQMKAARNAIWGDGLLSYLKVLEEWRAEGSLRGLHVSSAS